MMRETEARAGAAHEMKDALDGFMTDLRAFRSDILNRVQQQEDRMTILDRKSRAAQAARPPLEAAATEAGAPHKKALGAYLRTGDEASLRALEMEGKAMNTAVAGDGGYLVDPETAETIRAVLTSTASIRAIGNVVQVDATAYDVLVDHDEFGSGWAGESAAQTETSTPQIERISIPLHELSALPKISQRLLDDSAFDIEGWLAERIAAKFARAEAAAFIAGNGVDKPKGFLDHPSVPDAGWSWGSLGYIPTGVDGDFAPSQPADVIIDLVYSLGAAYRANASFVMNSKTAGVVRKMKDADGRFLWSDGLSQGEPARLLGYPVLIAEDMPDIATGTRAIAFGDFRAGYTIPERPDLRVLRDPFSAKPHVLFYATRRVGGDVSDFAAIKLVKFAAS